jgi:hypothetical protein
MAKNRETASENSRVQDGMAVTRYNLILPLALFQQVETVARREHVSMLEVLRHFIKVGIYLMHEAHDPHKTLIVRTGDRERELLLL